MLTDIKSKVFAQLRNEMDYQDRLNLCTEFADQLGLKLYSEEELQERLDASTIKHGDRVQTSEGLARAVVLSDSEANTLKKMFAFVEEI